MPERILFVTGRLAEPALRRTLAGMEPAFGWQVAVLPISVAALMTADWIGRHLAGWMETGNPGAEYDRVLLPGRCRGDLEALSQEIGLPAERGPKELQDLPAFFGGRWEKPGYGEYRAEIVAEIHDAPLLSFEELRRRAHHYRESGADIIDLGCLTDRTWPEVGRAVSLLKEEGFRVSLDTFRPEEILAADAAGVDLILSINGSNREILPKLHSPVVVVPDFEGGLSTLDTTLRLVQERGLPYVLDAILDPIPFGLTRSLSRFLELREKYPEADLMMGLHHVSELIDADSQGANAVMMGLAAELEVRYILTTEVVPWARGTLRELDRARRLMEYARANRILPKGIEEGLIALKSRGATGFGEEELRSMQQQLKDSNFRIYVDGDWIYAFNAHVFVKGQDPRRIFSQLGVEEPSHAFYLGRELTKAALARQLGKPYYQDEPLGWGYLTEDEAADDGPVDFPHWREKR